MRSVDNLAETCQADVEVLYRLLRALADIGVTEETTPRHFRLTPIRSTVAPLPRPSPPSLPIASGQLSASKSAQKTTAGRADRQRPSAAADPPERDARKTGSALGR